MNRPRSLRKPPEKGGLNRTNTASSASASHEPRNASPSRLPVKPLTRSATAAAVSKSSSSISSTGKLGGVARSLTGALGRSISTRKNTLDKKADAKKSATGTSAGGKYPPSSSRPVTSHGASKSISSTATRPTTSHGASGSSSSGTALTRARAQTSSHARGKSVTTLSGATVLRPPSQPAAASSMKSRPPPPLPQTRPTARTTTTIQPHTARIPPSASTASNAYSTTDSTAKPSNSRLQKPAFSTLQRHYSPAKSLAPKLPTSAFLAPPSPSKLPTNIAISAETLKLQNELLRLHILHREASDVDAQWRSSAEEVLRARFSALAKASVEVSNLEVERLEKANVLAIRRWGLNGARNRSSMAFRSSTNSVGEAELVPTIPDGGSGPSMLLEQKIQTLDSILVGLWNLTAPQTGKLPRVARQFDAWLQKVSTIMAARKSSTSATALLFSGGAGQQVLLVSELDASSWRHDLASVSRKLQGWSAQLRELGGVPMPRRDPPREGDGAGGGSGQGVSSLEQVLSGCRELVGGTLAEIDVMEAIRRESLDSEERWIRDVIQDDHNQGRSCGGKAGAIWRVI